MTTHMLGYTYALGFWPTVTHGYIRFHTLIAKILGYLRALRDEDNLPKYLGTVPVSAKYLGLGMCAWRLTQAGA